MLAFYLIRSKVARLRRVGCLVSAGLFNINEPITLVPSHLQPGHGDPIQSLLPS